MLHFVPHANARFREIARVYGGDKKDTEAHCEVKVRKRLL